MDRGALDLVGPLAAGQSSACALGLGQGVCEGVGVGVGDWVRARAGVHAWGAVRAWLTACGEGEGEVGLVVLGDKLCGARGEVGLGCVEGAGGVGARPCEASGLELVRVVRPREAGSLVDRVE